MLRADRFNSANHSRQINARLEQHMNVVGHYNPTSQLVESPVMPGKEDACHSARDIRANQPLRTGGARIEKIEGRELCSLGGPDFGDLLNRQRAGKAPS